MQEDRKGKRTQSRFHLKDRREREASANDTPRTKETNFLSLAIAMKKWKGNQEKWMALLRRAL